MIISSQVNNEKKIFRDYRIMLKNFHEQDADNIIPHMVMSHLFISWTMLLYEIFPSLLSDGNTPEQRERAMYGQYCHVARNFFKDVDFLTADEKAQFTMDGWKAYLDD